jgi:transketolase
VGEGAGDAVGMALGLRMDGKKNRVYCCLSDGEHDAGNIWESAMFAGNNKLSNLTVFVDRNNIQIDGTTEEVMPLEPLRGKWEAFNWHVLEVDGHNMRAIIDAAQEAQAITEKPTIIIAHTIPGKGIKQIEYDFRWHGKPPSKEEAAAFLTQLRTLKGTIQSPHTH